MTNTTADLVAALDLYAIAKDAAERVHKNGGCVPQLAFAPILFALQDALARAKVGGEPQGRPANCRNALRDAGKPYPRSGCAVCKNVIQHGCPYDRLTALQEPGQ